MKSHRLDLAVFMGEKSLRIRPQESESTQDVRLLIVNFHEKVADLKVRYEQYFAGIIPLPPDKLHAEVRRLLRGLRKAPFKSTAIAYKIKSAETTYHTYNTYWQKVLREKEEGRYHKDLFKAELRERHKIEDARNSTREGMTENQIQNLFRVYQGTIEKQLGRSCNLDYKMFRRNLVSKMKGLQEKAGGRKIKLKLVMKNGKISIKAVAKATE